MKLMGTTVRASGSIRPRTRCRVAVQLRGFVEFAGSRYSSAFKVSKPEITSGHYVILRELVTTKTLKTRREVRTAPHEDFRCRAQSKPAKGYETDTKLCCTMMHFSEPGLAATPERL